MFGKKKEPLPPYTLQALTTEYLIEGSVPGNKALFFFRTDVATGSPLKLDSVKIFATQAPGIPPLAAPQYVVLGNATVAFIPHMQFDMLPQSGAWKEYKHPLAGTFFAGPYVIKGRMMMLTESANEHGHPFFDVTITSRNPGTGWSGLYAPFALVNTAWLHGCIPGQV